MMIICPSCKRETVAGMRFCRHCGRLLADPDLDVAYAPVAPYFDRVNDVMGDAGPGASAVDVTQARVAIFVYPVDERGEVTDLATPIGEYALGGRDVTIGRGKGSDIVLAGDTLTSRRHAMLRRDHDRYLVVDLGSSNGTLLNGADLSEAAPLRHGDRVQVGNHELVYLLDASVQTDHTNTPQAPLAGQDVRLLADAHDSSYPSHTSGLPSWPAAVGSASNAAGIPGSNHLTSAPATAVAPHAAVSHAAVSIDTVDTVDSADGMDTGSVGVTAASPAIALTRVATQPAPSRRTAAPDLSGIRAKLVEAGEALAQEARANAAQAEQMRGALAQASARLREVAANLRGGPVSAAAGGATPNDLILLAQRVRENPNDLERLRAFADHADAIEGALLSVGQAGYVAHALEQLSAWLEAQAEAALPDATGAENGTTGER